MVQLSAPFLSRLQQHPWKGNIRELRNVIERAAMLADGPQLMLEHLPPDLFVDHGYTTKGVFDWAAVEQQHIRHVLALTKGNKMQAAQLLGLGLSTLYRKMRQ